MTTADYNKIGNMNFADANKVADKIEKILPQDESYKLAIKDEYIQLFFIKDNEIQRNILIHCLGHNRYDFNWRDNNNIAVGEEKEDQTLEEVLTMVLTLHVQWSMSGNNPSINKPEPMKVNEDLEKEKDVDIDADKAKRKMRRERFIQWILHGMDEGLQPLGGMENEQTSTGAVQGYSPINSFAVSGQKKNRGTEASEREGWTISPETKKLLQKRANILIRK